MTGAVSNPRSRPVPGLLAIGAAVLVLTAIAVVSEAVTLSFTVHSPLPQWDEWSNLAAYQSVREGRGLLQTMFAQHNEHRIFFPRFVLFSDYWLFRGRGIFDLGVTFTIQALHAALLIALARRCGIRRAGAAALGAVVVILMFSLRQSENFVWGFQVQFVGVFAAASLAATCFACALARHPERGGRAALLDHDVVRKPVPTFRHQALSRLSRTGPRESASLSCQKRQVFVGHPTQTCLAAAFVLATVSSFSMTNGLLSGVVLVVLAVLARASLWLVCGAAAFVAVVFAVFFHGYEIGPDHDSAAVLIGKPGLILAYTAAYLGNVIDNDMTGAIALGAAGLAALMVLACGAACRRDRSAAHLALLGIAMFAAGAAFITALGRSVDGIGGAMASRYATGGACFWSALLILAWSVAEGSRWRIAIRLLAGAAAMALIVPTLRHQADAVAYHQDRRYRYNVMEDALVQNLYDDAALTSLDENPETVRALVPWLRQQRLSIFAGRDAGLFGRPLTEAGPVAAQACAGTLEAAAADPGLGTNGVHVRGSAAVRHVFGQSSRIYVVDAEHRIVGFASTPFGANTWTGYATAPAATKVSAFAMVRSGVLCEIGSRIVSPASDALLRPGGKPGALPA